MDVTPSLAEELAQRAHRILRGHRFADDPDTLSLVNRAYLNMEGAAPRFGSRAEFLCYAAKAMRTVLLNLARDRQRLKRGSGARRVDLHEDVPDARAPETLVLDVDEKLAVLARRDPKLATLVELKFFGGCSWPELAEVTGRSEAALQADWAFARAWLRSGLADGEP